MPERGIRGGVPVQLSMAPLMALRAASDDEADDLLTRWEHDLGPCNRPFGSSSWVLDIDGQAAGVAVSASTVSDTVRMDDGRVFKRGELVELARIARAPEHPYLLRVLIRLWRAYVAPLWHCWPVVAAVSYATPGRTGDLYRFDGWQFGGIRRPSGGSGTWTRANPEVNRIGDGKKRLYLWPYPAAGDRALPAAREAA